MKFAKETWVCSTLYYLSYLLTSITEQLKILNTHITQSFEDTQSKFDKCYDSLSKLCKLLIESTSAFNDDEDSKPYFYSDSTNISSLLTLNDPDIREGTGENESWCKIEKVQRVSDCKTTLKTHHCKSQSRAEVVTKCSKLLEMSIQGVRLSCKGLTTLMQFKTLYIELFQIMVTQVERVS
jgi:hypothetical protein